MKLRTAFEIKKIIFPAIVFLLLSPTIFSSLRAQTKNESVVIDSSASNSAYLPNKSVKNGNFDTEKLSFERNFRVEKVPVAADAGAEVITIFMNVRGLNAAAPKDSGEVPLFSILRDTLGDQKPENDRLRYVWMMTYTKPSFAQRFASFIPFLYTRTTNKKDVGTKPPPPIMDLSPNGKDMWDKAFWMIFKSLILSNLSVPIKSSVLQNRQNSDDYRKSAISKALAVLALYESVEGEKILSDAELKDIQARMWLSDKTFGDFISPENLPRVYQNNVERIRDERGHNWELLRQYSEQQGLYFEPLEMPDGSATHALLWTAEGDLAENKNRKFDSRFLNIKNPWKDSRLTNWRGYREVRWFDEDNRLTAPETPGARAKTMIPLALYGLDYPKIPILLVDFRDRDNPKKREMSRRVLDDLTKNVLAVSKFGNLPYFVGRYLYDFVTRRRGMDVNQGSRFRSYSQLKLLLSLDASLEPDFRDEIADRLETVSLNPLENDLDVEVKLARKQYDNLMNYAKRPDGLAKLIGRDRREEMTRLKYGGKQRMMYALGHLASFGIYTHREKETPELLAQMDIRRRLDYHERFLLETARLSAKPEVDSDLAAIKRSLDFVAQNGGASSKTVRAIARIFSITEDEQTRYLCLKGLEKNDGKTSKKEMLALYEDRKIEAHWRNVFAKYLNLSAVENAPVISTASEKAALKSGGN
ncbi:MAG: hypothetical protein ACR2L1_02070 [Pyrinomonadaceae bacterium]